MLVGALLIGLQTDAVGTFVAQQATARFNPFDGTTLTVGTASGNWLSRLRLTNVRVTRLDAVSGDTLEMARIDTVAARYRLLPLLRGRVLLRNVTVAGPQVTLRQAPDSTWDWARALGLYAPDTTTSDLRIRLQDATLRRGGWTARLHTPPTSSRADSVLRASGVRVQLHDLRSGPQGLRLRLDTLGLRGHPPGDTTALHLGTRATLSEAALHLDTLRLRSSASRVDAGGTVRWGDAASPAPGDSLGGASGRGRGTASADAKSEERRDVRFHLAAAPLSFRDLAILAPTLGLDPAESVALDLRTHGSRRLVDAELSARFNNGGRLNATATATPSAIAPDTADLRYRLDARLRSLTTSLLAPRDSTINRLSGRLSADLRGPRQRSLNGPLAIELRQTRLFGMQTDALDLRAAFTQGDADLSLSGDLNRARLTAEGHVRPLDPVPTYNVEATVRTLNIAAFAPDAGIQSRINGTVRASGRAFQGDSLNVGLGITLQPSTVATQAIRGGSAMVRVTPDTLAAEADLSFPDGGVQLEGRAALDGSERFQLTTARFDAAPLLALAGDTTRSTLTGTLAAQGQRFDPQTMALDATVTVDTFTYARFRLQPLRTTLSLERGALQSRTTARLNGSTWAFGLSGRPFDVRPRFRLAEGRFRNVDVGALLGDTTQTSALNGTLAARLRGTDPSALQMDVQLGLDTSRVNRARLQSGTLAATLDAGTLTAQLDLTTPHGEAHFAGRAAPFQDRPTFALSEGTVRRLDLAAFAGRPADTTAVSGQLTLTGAGQTLGDLTLDAALALDTTRVNRATLTDGAFALTARAGRLALDGDLGMDGGRFAMQATIDSLDTRPVYSLDVRADTLNLGALASRAAPRGPASPDTSTQAPPARAAPPPDVRLDTLRWTLRGRGTDPQTLTARTSLRGAGLRALGIRARNLRLDGQLDAGRLTVDTLRVASTVALLNGGGTLALFDTTAASRFDLYAEATGAAPLQDLVGAQRLSIREGTAEVHVTGEQGTLAFDGQVTLRDLFYNNARTGETSATFSGQASVAEGLQSAEGSAQLNFLSMPGLTVQRITTQATYDTSRIDLTAFARLEERYTAALAAAVDTRAGQEQITLRQLDLQLQSDQWELLQDATITYADAYRVRGLLLLSGDQQVAADGVVDFDGRQSLIVTVEQMRMGPLATLAGLTGLGGRLTGTIDLTGTAADPRLDGSLDLDISSSGEDVGALRLTLDYASLALGLDATLTHAEGGTFTVNGTVPIDLRLASSAAANVAQRSVAISARAQDFSVGWVDPFIDPALLRDIGGMLNATVDVSGTRARPSFSGRATLRDGSAYVPDLETRYDRAQATLVFEAAQANVQDARIRSDNGGRLDASGRINFDELTLGSFDLALDANDFIAIDTRAYRTVVIDGDLTLRGTTRRPVLDGTVDVQRADVYYAEATGAESTELAAVQLTPADERDLEQRFDIRITEADTTTFDAYQAMAMNLTVRIERDTWIRSEGTPELNVQFTGDLTVSKSVNQDAQVFGSIEVVSERSTIRQFGQEFRIDDGTLTFNGDPLAPYLRIAAVYEQRARQTQETEVTITLSLEGRPDDLTPSLSSDPPMETRNILAYLATGQPANQLLSGEGGQSENLATRVALGQATNFVENLAASELGLDVVRIQLRPNGTSYLTLGRYFTPRFFASIEQPVTPLTSTGQPTNSSPFVPDLTLEYQLNRYLLLRALNRQQSLQLNLLIEHAY